MKKVAVLIGILLIPGAFYLFLRFFGENRFDVPLYFDGSAPCGEGLQGQYHRVPHFSFMVNGGTLGSDSGSHAVAVYDMCLSAPPLDSRSHLRHSGQIHDAFAEEQSVLIYSLYPASAISSMEDALRVAGDYRSDSKIWSFGYAEDAAWKDFALCGLGIGASDPDGGEIYHALVLVDSKRRVRGFYRMGDQDETDRLIMEAKIVLRE